MRYLPGLLIVTLIAAPGATAAVKLASPFASHVVLQRDKPLPVWGTADADADVTVTLGDRRATAKADKAGRWSASLDALPAGGPLLLTATSNGSATTVDDVLIGDVFLCSGQSNMQYGLGEAADFAAVAGAPLPKLRLGVVGLNGGAEPKESCDVQWHPASPDAAKKFSAVAYCMALELYRQDPGLKDVPIGMLEDCVGATVIESWLPKPALAKFDPKTLAMSMFGIGPSVLYNGMIAPLGKLPLAGVVWYQGEGNAGEPARYGEYLPLLMSSWREQLAQPELPFLIVQLPDYAPDWGGVYWQWIRESQAKAAAATPHAGYVVTLNTNDGWDLHPQGKHEIGRRLAMLAREIVYHEPEVHGRSPTFKSAAVDGGRVRVTFDACGSTLTSGTNAVEGFALAGEDGVYHAATAVIEGADTVVVTASCVPTPKTVRYAWAGVPRSTLSSTAGLPAAPFRTDDQPVAKGGEVQRSPTSHVFKSPRYQLTIDGNGRATSLVVGYKQLLSNADAPWGGSSLTVNNGARFLADIRPDGPGALRCKGGDLSADLRFDDDAIRWSITNQNGKDAAQFKIALSPQVEVKDGDAKGVFVVRRKDATVTFSNVDRVTTYNDPAADVGGKVLDVTIPAGETRTIEINVSR